MVLVLLVLFNFFIKIFTINKMGHQGTRGFTFIFNMIYLIGSL